MSIANKQHDKTIIIFIVQSLLSAASTVCFTRFFVSLGLLFGCIQLLIGHHLVFDSDVVQVLRSE